MTAPHPFRPDHVGEVGYRPRCRDCGQERHRQSPQVPVQRSEGVRVPDKPPDAPQQALRARTGHSGQTVTTTTHTDTTAPPVLTEETPCSSR